MLSATVSAIFKPADIYVIGRAYSKALGKLSLTRIDNAPRLRLARAIVEAAYLGEMNEDALADMALQDLDEANANLRSILTNPAVSDLFQLPACTTRPAAAGHEPGM